MRRWLLFMLVAMLCACAPLGRNPASLGNAESSGVAQLPALSGGYFHIDSVSVGRGFHIHVRLPEGYDASSSRTYPVVYVLDGDSLFPLLAPTHLFLSYDEKLPEAIIVGISYGGFQPTVNKRNIDFSAPAVDARPGEGGAPRFLGFLKDELIPDVERRYKVNAARRVLVGQSRGGYFVLWSAVQDPDLFWGRIASNPGLMPGHDQFFTAPARHSTADLRVAVAYGTRDAEFGQRNAVEWADAWLKRLDAPWHIRLIEIQGGTHAASIGETYRQAMLWLFASEIPVSRKVAAP